MTSTPGQHRPGFSLKYRIAAIIFALEAVMMATVLGVTLTYSTQENQKQLSVNEQVMLNLLADLSRIALLTTEYDELQPYIEQVVADPHVEAVLLTNFKNRVVVSSDHARIGEAMPPLNNSENRIWRSTEITNVNGRLGTLAIRFSHAQLIETNRDVLNLGVTVALTGMILIAVVGVLIGFLLTRRLDVVATTAQRLAAGDFSVRTALRGKDEVALVGQTFDHMADSVEEHMVALREMTDALEQRVAERTTQLAEARDEAISADRSKSAFLANMSHEIRTPLTAIIGFSESLLDSRQTMEERVGAINTITRSGKHLLGIINDILDLSKIEADKLEIERIPVNPFELLNDVEALVSLMAQEKGLTVSVDYEFPLPATLLTDPVRLKQILINLCNNAIKFSQEGSVRVTVSCECEDRSLTLKVIDTGIGMTEQQIARLFQPFTQADSSTTRKFGGSGLGLHLSRHLAKKLGGQITVESAPHVGSSFTLTIDTGPLDGVEFVTERPAKTTSAGCTPRVDSFRGQVLLAEDNADNQQLISMYLSKAGAEVEIANNGQEAVDKALGRSYDLVFMDMQMPIKDGLTATRELRARGYTGPIVALTANALKSDAENCFAAGCDEFITKPIERGSFTELLARHLEQRDKDAADDAPITSTLLEDDPELLTLVHQFVDKLPNRVDMLRQAYRNDDLETLKFEAHSLKGASGNYGYAEIYKNTQKIEFELVVENRANIAALLDELDKLVLRAKRGLPSDADTALQTVV